MSAKDGAHHGPLLHHFDNLHQQRTSVTLGMWVFLVTEVLFFGGLFMAYVLYRSKFPVAFAAASNHLDVTMGAVNTAILICSSLTMALAVHSGHTGNRKAISFFIVLTMIFGAIFLGVKAFEYHHKFVEGLIPGSMYAPHDPHLEGPAQLFFFLYFVMTGLHATHMIIGFGIMITLLIWNHQGRFTKEYSAQIEVSGLYWHFVDIVWIFLFPLLYLIGR